MSEESTQFKMTEEALGKPQHLLAFVDADIISGKDEVAREELLENVRRYRSNGVAPLWVNWLRHRADLRFVCLVRDVSEFNDFMLDVVRNVEGVRETGTILSFGGRADIDTLLDVVGEYLDDGYRRIKLKIKPGWDIEPTRAVREKWPDLALQVDANSIYTLGDAEHLAELDEFNLLLIEQPLPHDDIFDHAKLVPQVNTPICLDESIVSSDHARWALEMNACGIINIKPSRIGGFVDAIRIHDLCQAHNVPVWHGGMLETGIGRASNVALASLPNFSLPGDISANSRYFHRDIVTNPFTLNEGSTLTVPTTPGCGAIVDEAYLEEVTVDKLEFRPQ